MTKEDRYGIYGQTLIRVDLKFWERFPGREGLEEEPLDG